MHIVPSSEAQWKEVADMAVKICQKYKMKKLLDIFAGFFFFSSVKREVIEMFVIKDGECVGLSLRESLVQKFGKDTFNLRWLVNENMALDGEQFLL